MSRRLDPDSLFATRKGKPIPFEFVLDELASVGAWTRPMFGCTSVYVGEKIVLILRDGKADTDNGVWLATTKDHHRSLREVFPNMRSIEVFGVGETGWQVLPADAEDFESAVMLACELVRRADPRIGKVPNSRAKKGTKRVGPKKNTPKKRTSKKKEAPKRRATKKPAPTPAAGRAAARKKTR